jgi:GR25 family glycosyltransferase involved in LPS biosynthesis
MKKASKARKASMKAVVMKKVAMKAAPRKLMKVASRKAMKAVRKPAPKKPMKAVRKVAMKKKTAKKMVKMETAPSADVKELTALVVNLKKREDRWERVSAHLRTELPWLTFERFFATYGKDDPIPDDHVAPTWNTKCNANYGEYEDTFGPDGKLLHSAASFLDPGVSYLFSPGERGCAHSHYRIWQKVAESKIPILVLEDDVKLNFERTGGNGVCNGKILTGRLNLGMEEAKKRAEGMDVLYLGWSGHRDGNFRYLKNSRGRKSSIIRRVEYVWTTVAYVLWPEGARKLLKAASPMDQPVDNFMAWEAREGRLNSFVLLDSGDQEHDWSGGVVDQYDFQGDSDVVKSDGGHQGDDPTAFLATSSPQKADVAAADAPMDEAPVEEAAMA